ncbi:hypothetical protein GCM10009665_19300 [Kitasatospora nipponensis]|uniref:Uncharacterized protein n=1 Tax=Kitasatospora nipponensis TaxID=258049 RepID=A0ABN1W520_9ACTN
MIGKGEDDADVHEARRLLDTPWRTDPEAILEGARRLIALGPPYVEEAVQRISLVFTTNYHLGAARRIAAARLRAGLGGEHVPGAAAGLRCVVTEYRGYVEAWDNVDGAHALATLAPEYLAEGAWELRAMILSSYLDDVDRGYAIRHLADLRGPGRQPRLPDERPEFPLYGLPDGTAAERWVEERWVEERWVEAWGTVKGGADRPLWFAGLGHRLRGGATVVVSTWQGLAGGRHGEHGPAEALAHARVDSLAGALHLAFPRDGDGARPEQDFRATAAAHLPLGAHQPTLALTVDGSRTTFEVRRVRDAWAAVADLGPHAIGLYGRGTEPDDLPPVIRTDDSSTWAPAP